jgi:hypothetical protein
MEKVTQVPKPIEHPSSTKTMPVVPPPVTPAPKSKSKINHKVMLVGIGLLVVVLGLGSGKILAQTTSPGSTSTVSAPEVEKKNNESGSSDLTGVDEQAPEGVLKEGGIDGEGTHHLERPGGVSQNVYLSSTVLNLQDFVDKKVQIWGNTISGKKAGWLMDVVKVKELN